MIETSELVGAAVAAVEEAFGALLRPEKRVYWVHLAGAAVLTAWVWARHVRGRRSLLGYLFARRVWLHRSAREDYGLILLRAALRILFTAPFVVATVPVTLKLTSLLAEHAGPSPLPALSRGAVGVLFTVAAFVADDFTRFALHYLAHRVPVLWELHKVHHSAEVLTPFTVYRVHPIEAWLNGVRGATTTAVVAALVLWAFPGRLRGVDILGVGALGFIWSITGANLRHSQVWLSYGRIVEHVLISPAQHQIHHSRESRHYDRNFGSALALWDWLFGTLYVPQRRERLSYGLPADVLNHRPGVIAMLVDPVVAVLRRLVPRFSFPARRSGA